MKMTAKQQLQLALSVRKAGQLIDSHTKSRTSNAKTKSESRPERALVHKYLSVERDLESLGAVLP